MAMAATSTSGTTAPPQHAPGSSHLQGPTQDGVDEIAAGDAHATGHRKADDGANAVQAGGCHPDRGDHCKRTDSMSESQQYVFGWGDQAGVLGQRQLCVDCTEQASRRVWSDSSLPTWQDGRPRAERTADGLGSLMSLCYKCKLAKINRLHACLADARQTQQSKGGSKVRHPPLSCPRPCRCSSSMPVTSTVGEMAAWMKPAVKDRAMGILNSLSAGRQL